MNTLTFTASHGYEVGDILLMNGKPVKIIALGNSTSFSIGKLSWRERLIYSLISFARNVAELYEKTVRCIRNI